MRWLADDDFSCFGVRRPGEHVGRKSYLYSTHTHKPYTRTSSRIGTRSTWPLNSTFIILHNDEWKISFKDKHYGPYATQAEAIEAAVDAAYAMGEIGIDAQVLVEEANHQLRTEWTYGQSFNAFR
jgi:hypothetical protein